MIIVKNKEPIKIIHLEDSSEDAELISTVLNNGGNGFIIRLATDRQSLIESINKEKPDVILSDFNIPGFNGFEALEIVKNKIPDVPFIFITGAVGEEMAVNALKSGATDFILKDNPGRLLPVITRAIDEKKTELERKKLYYALLHSEERYRTLMENLPVSVFRVSYNKPIKILHANLSAALIYGFESISQFLGASPDDLYLDPDNRIELFLNISKQKRIKNRLIRFKKRSNELFWGSLSAICHFDINGIPDWIDCVVEDITERIVIEEKLSGYLRFFETLIDTINTPVFYKDISGKYLGCNRNFAEMIIGLSKEKIIGKTDFELYDTVPQNIAEAFFLKDVELFKNPGLQEYESRIKCKDDKTRHFQFSKTTYTNPDETVAGLVGIMMDVSSMIEKENELKRINEEFEVLLTSLPSIIIGVSTKDRITHWNRYAETVFGIKTYHVMGRRFYEAGIKWNWEIVYEAIGECVLDEKSIRIDDLKFENDDGRIGILGLTINPLKRGGDILEGFMILGKDVTEQRILESQLLQTNKLEAIGQLAAGVAHEINTPLQYVGDNLKFINKSFSSFITMLDDYEKTCYILKENSSLSSIVRNAEDLRKKIKLPFLIEEVPKALEQALEGVTRVSKIVQSMKAFSHPGTGNKNPTNLNKAIENTVTISRNEWKYDAELKLELEPELPEVPCFESEFNQVILNLIVNATDAIHSAKETGIIETGIIKIKTIEDSEYAVITIEDNGTGIPLNIRDRIFDPFFTTKEVGKGTGQGLAISYSIIVEKHKGIMYFESEPGNGTAFIIKLPLQ